VRVHHHEVSSGGQGEIDMRFQPLLRMADQMMIYKYVVKNEARRAGKTATFMPKPIFEENGSGMHVHSHCGRTATRLMFEEGAYAHLSPLARHYIGGLLAHAPALLAFCARPPTPTAGWSRLRGAGQPRVLGPQPLGLRTRADVPRVAQEQAGRVPLARPDREPVPGVQRADARRPRRDQAGARPGEPLDRRHLRAAARPAREHRDRALVARGLARRAGVRPQFPFGGRRVSRLV